MTSVRKKRIPGPEAGEGLVLALDEIEPFDRDPRQSPNTEYMRIKASIQVQGVDQPLVVTRRPRADRYLIAAGGNTRLKILRELLQETGDTRFAQVACVFKPWRGEAEVVLAHLRENDLRGGLTFLDKARAVREVLRLIESEEGGGTVTQIRLVERLKARGYGLSQTSLSHMEYVVDILEPRLPLAMRAGLSHKDVMKIRTFESAACALWNDRVAAGGECFEGGESFEQVFTLLCQRYDGPDWDFLSLRQALEAEIADRLNQTVHAVRLALDARLNGVIEVALPSRAEDDEWWPEPVEPKTRLTSRSGEPMTAQPSAAGDGPSAPTPGASDERPGSVILPAPATSDRELERPAVAGATELSYAGDGDLARLRVEAAQLAAALAERHGLGELIVPLPDTGTGFVVIDVPPPALLEQLDEATLAQTSTIWWQLMACAEMTVAPISCLLPHLAPSCVLYRALRDQDAGLLFNAVWTLDPGQVGFRLWRTVSEQDWSDLLALMSCYRNLHRIAAASGAALWRTAT